MTPQRDDTGAEPQPQGKKRGHRKGGSNEAALLTPPAGVERTCIVSRRTLPADQLLSLALVGDQVVPGRAQKNRGAYVAIEREALLALDARVLSRAFRTGIKGFDAKAFVSTCHGVAEQKVLERIGLARRSGRLILGIEAVLGASAKATVVLASDLSERSQRKVEGNLFTSGEALGAAAGIGWVGALAISSGQLAKEASYWLRVWYETALSEEAHEETR